MNGDVNDVVWDRLYKACQHYAESFERSMELRAGDASDEEVSKVMGQTILNLHALRDALELTPGEWDANDIDVGFAAVKGEVNLVSLYKKAVKEEIMTEMLNTAVIHDEDDNILNEGGETSWTPGEYAVTVTEAWRDETGQLHVRVKRD
jgi:hypothetical protein